jgi:protoporphyrinogen oxidase
LTAGQWLVKTCGAEVYRVVWEPLLRGKFGEFAPDISAVWLWSKLVLRGGSRYKDGREMLLYYRDGFAAFAERIADEIRKRGGEVLTGTAVSGLSVKDGHVKGIMTTIGEMRAKAVIATPELPIVADLIAPHTPARYTQELREIKYLANLCLVLALKRRLSDFYWLNVIDPAFPFIGVIEHTNLEPATTYGGNHIVYLSKYLTTTDPLYHVSDDTVFESSLPRIGSIFPSFDRSWVRDYHVWRAPCAQPIVVKNYRRLIPKYETPISGLYIATMAQIYPEDRGTNYAIREGRRLGRIIADL